MKKTVFVFSGPSGAGKSTLINLILKNYKNIKATVSCTTRKKREGETDGVQYHFISQAHFLELVEQNQFIEYIECYGNKYGTLKNSVHDTLKENDGCIIDADFAGAYKILSENLFNEFNTVGILILPPSLKSLEERLLKRNTETEESLKIRIDNSFKADRIADYKHVLINKDLENSTNEIFNILKLYNF